MSLCVIPTRTPYINQSNPRIDTMHGRTFNRLEVHGPVRRHCLRVRQDEIRGQRRRRRRSC